MDRVQATLDSDLANWRLQQMRALWREDGSRGPSNGNGIYPGARRRFVRQEEIYRIHSGSRVRPRCPARRRSRRPAAAVYVAGRSRRRASSGARQITPAWVDAFGTSSTRSWFGRLRPPRSGSSSPLRPGNRAFDFAGVFRTSRSLAKGGTPSSGTASLADQLLEHRHADPCRRDAHRAVRLHRERLADDLVSK